MKKSFFRASSVLALCLLLANPPLAFEGAKTGLLLWAQVVLPTLLPFMICSNVIVALDAIYILIFPVKGLLHSVFRLSDAGSYILVSGLLCGYPMGAKTCSEFMDDGKITVAEGRYLLSICNHPSPMFILGYVSSLMAPSVPIGVLMASVYLPVLAIAAVSRRFYRLGKPAPSACAVRTKPLSFDDNLMNSCEVMVKIGGYIMIFSILALYITRFPIHSQGVTAILLGLIEITTGISAIAAQIPGLAGCLMIAGVTAFGGLSGIFQTNSVMKNAGLSIRHYIGWKIVHSLLSMITFLLLASLLPGLGLMARLIPAC